MRCQIASFNCNNKQQNSHKLSLKTIEEDEEVESLAAAAATAAATEISLDAAIVAVLAEPDGILA